jgi:hypothetical protein
MSDDLVRRANYALNDMQGRVEAGKLAVFEECIARIEELEAKLAKAPLLGWRALTLRADAMKGQNQC